MKKIDLNTTVEQYKSLKHQIALLEAQAEALAYTLKTVMGESEEIVVGCHVVRYKNITSNRFDTTSFKKAHADMYNEFCKPSASRRFTIA